MDTFENNQYDELENQISPEETEEILQETEAEAQPEDLQQCRSAAAEEPEQIHRPEPVQPPVTTYRQTGSGRRESPYANSPYEMNRPPHQPYTPGYTFQPQTQPKPRVKKERKKLSLPVKSTDITVQPFDETIAIKITQLEILLDKLA